MKWVSRLRGDPSLLGRGALNKSRCFFLNIRHLLVPSWGHAQLALNGSFRCGPFGLPEAGVTLPQASTEGLCTWNQVFQSLAWGILPALSQGSVRELFCRLGAGYFSISNRRGA